MTTLSGEMIIGAAMVRGADGVLHAINASTGEKLEPAYLAGGVAEVDRACALADAAFDTYRNTSPEDRARFLERIADEIEALGDTLLERASLESGLPLARLTGERGRTTGQLRLFAQTVRAGRWQSATIDRALPQRAVPRPDLRLQKIAVGPVAVFGASNFPLAFSVAGGDTASALAAGCPVVVKAHPAHLGTSELVGRAIQKAVVDSKLPEGVFSLLVGAGNELGGALVKHDAIQAVGFTGSRAGGLALAGLALARKQPIPVYAEMSSINPMFVLPSALEQRGAAIAKGFIDSLVMGVGQFCTNPGLVIALEGPALQTLREAASAALVEKPAGVMLTRGIHSAYVEGEAARCASGKVNLLAAGQQAPDRAQAAFYETSAENFLAHESLGNEVFGPSSLLVVCRNVDEVLAVARGLEGQLTATLQADAQDRELAGRLLRILERKAGRVLFNGFPTGVEVCHAMVHGGPFPATTDSRSTSVGTMAIERYLRPVCYQDVPAELLPAALSDDNPLGLWRLVEGELGKQ